MPIETNYLFWNAVWVAHIQTHANLNKDGYPVLEVDGIAYAVTQYLAIPECLSYNHHGKLGGTWFSTNLVDLVLLCQAHYTEEELQTFQLKFELQGCL